VREVICELERGGSGAAADVEESGGVAAGGGVSVEDGFVEGGGVAGAGAGIGCALGGGVGGEGFLGWGGGVWHFEGGVDSIEEWVLCVEFEIGK